MPELAFAGYHSFTPIGRGGLGDVFRAVQTATGSPVAVKVLRDVTDTSTAWHRTRRELTALQTLSGHPNVIESIELVERTEGPALVMEYASGGSLADLLQAREASGSPNFTIAETLFVARQTATALVAAHERGIVHRDIKPQNLLIDGHGQIKLCDFGIAALTHDERFRTRTNAVSMRYASPEDLESDQPVGPPSDVYSLGATMLHLAHGAPPTLRDRLSPWIPPERDDAGWDAVDQIIASCLHPSPPMRPTAARLLVELEQLATSTGAGIVALPVVDGHDRGTIREVNDEVIDEGIDERIDEGIEEAIDAPLIRFDDPTPSPSQATTVRRPRGAIRPETAVIVTRPKIEPRSRRSLVVLTGIIGAALVVAMSLIGWLTTRGGEAAATFTTTARPVGLAPLVEADWSAGATGDCLVQSDQQALRVVDCRQPHDLQRFATGSLAEMEGEYDASSITAAVDALCSRAFATYVGTSTATSRLEIAQTRPSNETWRTGDRSYHCYLGVPDERIAGDASGARW